MFGALLNNTTLVLSLCIVFRLLLPRLRRQPAIARILLGVTFGFGTIIAMLNPWQYAPGIIFDGRSILAGLAGVFGGPIAGAVAFGIGSSYRLLVGGSGALTGVGVMASSVVLGVAYGGLRRRGRVVLDAWTLFAFGVIVHLFMLLLMLTLPGGVGLDVARTVAPPVLLIFPAATVIAGLLHADQEARYYAQQARERSADRIRIAFGATPFPIAIATRAGRILFSNQAFRDLFFDDDRHDETEANIVEIYREPADRDRMLESLRSSSKASMEAELVTASGRVIWALLSYSRMIFEGQEAVVGALMEITERKRLEAERLKLLHQSRIQQKLEAIGTLASGVAHEINNPINGVINYAQLIVDAEGEDSDSGRYAQEIITETQRVATIVRDLLAFSRHDKPALASARISDVVESTLSLIRTIMRHDEIQLLVSVPETLPPVLCRPQQIQQVLMNLLTNARHALNTRYVGHHDDKILEVTASEIEEGGRRFVRVVVEDHGGGVPLEVQDRIFDPFFTTKGREAGTGLGLSISHGIVREHGGRLGLAQGAEGRARFELDLVVGGEDA